VIRELEIGDLAGCLDMAVSRDWGAEEHKWRLLFDVGTVFGYVEDHAVVGTLVSTSYEPGVVALSMMLVAESYERRGIGRALLSHALDHAGAGAVVYLSATPMGQPLYERLGFVKLLDETLHVGAWAAGHATGTTREATPDDLTAIAALDTAVFGADRFELVRRLPSFDERLRVIWRAGSVVGYGGAWMNIDTTYIGPVIAESFDDTCALIDDLAGPAPGRVRIDLTHDRAELRDWVTKRGLEPIADTWVMVHEGRTLPGDRARLWAPVMQALG